MKEQQTTLQAIVLAGGFGTRLSPLTDSKPKPLVRILDTTVLENVLCSLNKTGIENVVVSTFYKSEMIEELCKRVNDGILCKKEAIPLGTAGGVKHCYDGKSEHVVVVSGDGVFDFDLHKVIAFHVENNNDVTIVACRMEDPTEYGVVQCDEKGTVTGFSEKPSWSEVRSNLVNTGIYVLSKRVIDNIPSNMKYDFSNDLFPKLLADSFRVCAFETDGFWCDIGTFDEYYRCLKMATMGKIKLCSYNGEDVKKLSEKGIHAKENVYVSKEAFIGKNVSIADNSVINRGTYIHDNCDICGSVIGNGCVIGAGTSITGTIIGDNVTVGENCMIPCGCVVGDGSIIGEGSVLPKQRRIKYQSIISKEDKMNVGFSDSRCVFVNDGLAVIEKHGCAQSVSDFARAVSGCYKKSNNRPARVAVMTDENAKNVSGYFISGLECENAVVLKLGVGSLAMCKYACPIVLSDVIIHISADEKKIYFSLLSCDGEYVDINEERKILKIFPAVSETDESEIQDKKQQIVNIPVCEMYSQTILAVAEKILGGVDFSGVKLCLKNKKGGISDSFKSVFEALEGKLSAAAGNDGLSAELTSDGTEAVVKCGEIVLDHFHVVSVILANSDILGISRVKCTSEIPFVLNKMIKALPENTEQNYSALNPVCDGTVALILLLCVMVLRAEPMSELVKDIPKFEVFTDEYIADVNRGATMERLSKLYTNSKSTNGIHLDLSDGTVTVIPNRASGFKIVAEAQSMEAAKEIAFKVGEAIKN